MDIRRLRFPPDEDPAVVTAVQAAAVEVGSASELEELLRFRGWGVEIVEQDGLAALGQPVLDVRRLDTVSTRNA